MKAPTILAIAAPMWIAACGGGSPNSAGGQLGFNAAWAGANLVSESGGEVLELLISDANLSGACSNSSGGDPPSGEVRLLVIGVGAQGSVAPGDYPVYDLNGQPPPATVTKLAVAQLGTVSQYGSSIEATAVSGSVTLSATGEHGSKGTFDMTMTLADGGGPGGKLTGTFDADVCVL